MSQDLFDESGFGDEGNDAELAATVADQSVGEEIIEETEVKGRDAEVRGLPTATSSKTSEQCS